MDEYGQKFQVELREIKNYIKKLVKQSLIIMKLEVMRP